jgi:D-tyrosyl-tRNA(Tyr) deacylase
MRVLLQRVSRASVTVEDEVVGQIGAGLLLLVGVGEHDGEREAEYLAGKIATMRIFPDADGRMNLSLLDAGGAALVVSQFTLYADVRKGRRPSFIGAAQPDVAVPLLARFVAELEAQGVPVEQGRFGAMMDVELVNDGPVTIWIDSAELLA